MADSKTDRYVIGVDYGTLSGRAVVVRVHDGAELGSAVHEYPHAVLDSALPDGTPLPPDWALQVPADYVEVLQHAVPAAVEAAGVDPADVIGVGIDFTACTMVPVLADGTPLNELPEYAGRPHAYVKLWKHHAAQGQADRITDLAAERHEPWLGRYGGMISSEWQLAKGLQVLEEDRELYDRMDRFVEAADWIIERLGGTAVRNACTAGYKGLLQEGAYPSTEFLAALNPDFGELRRHQARRPDRRPRHRRRPPHRRGGRLDRSARGHRRRGGQRRRARHRPGGGCGRPRHHGRRHGHLDVPRAERRPVRRGARHVRRGRRRHHRRLLGLRGRPVRRRRHLRLVRRALRPRRAPRPGAGGGPEHPRRAHRARRGRAGRRIRPHRPRLGERQPLRARRPRALRRDRRPHPRDPSRAGVPRARSRPPPSAPGRSSRPTSRAGSRSTSSSPPAASSRTPS